MLQRLPSIALLPFLEPVTLVWALIHFVACSCISLFPSPAQSRHPMCQCFHASSSLLPAHAPTTTFQSVTSATRVTLADWQTTRVLAGVCSCQGQGRQRNRGPSSDLAGPRQAKGGGTCWPSCPRCRILPCATISHKIKLLALRISSLAGPHLQRQPLGRDNTSHANTPVVATAQQPEPCPHFLGLLLGLRRRRGSMAAWVVVRVHQG